MSALQTIFAPAPKAFVPMLDRRGVLGQIVDQCDILYSEDDLAGDLDLGEFEWVFDLSSREQSRRAELRFFPGSVAQRIRKIQNPKWSPRRVTLDEVVRTTVPPALRRHGAATVESPKLAQALGCSPDLIIKLIDEGLLVQFGSSAYRPGRGGAAIISMSSVENLLKTRALA